MTLEDIAGREVSRAQRSGNGFSLLRIAPAGWSALDAELDELAALAVAHVRRGDFVLRVRSRELAVVLVDATLAQADAPLQRLRAAVEAGFPSGRFLMGCAAVGPGQRRTWQEAWRWAGQLLLAGAAAPAAA